MKPSRFASLVLFACLPACRAPAPAEAPAVLFENGRIWLSADAEAPVEALLVRGGRVVAGGSDAEVRARLDGTERVLDLGGGTVVPGLQDAHGHLENLGELLETLDLTACATYRELVELVRARAAALPAGTWIVGRGWDQTRWPGGDFPHHAELSRATPEHPVYLRRVDGHAALVNAHALGLAGLDRVVPYLEGGRVHVGADGQPTGVLIDQAMDLVARHRPEPDDATRRRRLLAAQEVLLAAGLVGVHDMGLTPDAVRILRELEDEGLWKLRVTGYVWANEGLPPALAVHPTARDLDPRNTVRILGAKLMLDGALGSRGAALLADYSDAPGEQGHLLHSSPAAFRARLAEVVDAGLQPAVHAIGDRANRVLLDAYAARLAEDPDFARLRPRVEHAQVVARADRERFEALGVLLSMQPTHATSDMRWAEARLGPERVLGAYAWRRLADDPAALVFGSDFPVEHFDPLEGLYAAVTRQDHDGSPEGGWFPDQRLTAREALAAFSAAPAHAAREEHLRGKLLPGFFADFTVLDVDPLEGDALALLAAEATQCVIDGEVVYRRGDG